MPRVTNSHVSSIPLYEHCLSEHCLWVNIVPVKTLCPLGALVIQVPLYKICLFNRHCQFRRSQVSTNDRHSSNIWYINMSKHSPQWSLSCSEKGLALETSDSQSSHGGQFYFINFLPNVSPEAIDCEQFLFCSRSVSERDTWVYEQRSREHRVVRASCSLALAHKFSSKR